LIYGKYQNARNASWQCLIDNKICALPIKILKITKNLDIQVSKNSDVKLLKQKESGRSYIDEYGKWCIVYDDEHSKQRCRFTIAHELGHIVLGHKLKNGHHARTFDLSKPETETEADVFASRLLAPACVLWALDLHTAEEIAKICEISLESAGHRAERMEILYERNKFLTSPLEKQVFKNFEEFINKQKNILAEPPLNEDLDKHLLDKN
jgi:Zn-dependent peptidase ImmA (M78 family)